MKYYFHKEDRYPCILKDCRYYQTSPFQNINQIYYPVTLQKLIFSNFRACSCTKTKCLKKYCECLTNNQYCNEKCTCVDCHNNREHEAYGHYNISQSNMCTCTKSFCNKKYCECYKANRFCSINCRCINCYNKQEYTNAMKSISLKNNLDFIILDKINIYIENNSLQVDEQKSFYQPIKSNTEIDMESDKLLKRKRNTDSI